MTSFNLAQKSYSLLWESPDSKLIDFGIKNHLDTFYKDVVKTQDFLTLRKNSKNKTIVDAGAGRGSRLVRMLAKKPFNIIAIDCYDTYEANCLRYKATALKENICKTSLKDNSVDLLVSAYLTLQNPQFNAPEEHDLYLQEVLRVLKPGGIFWAEELNLIINKNQFGESIQNYAFNEKFNIHFLKKKN
jgi:ubiquinone/menaquinone biosynthesis C-methylase UbiE